MSPHRKNAAQARTTPKGYPRARELRKDPTPAEAKLWAYLRGNKLNGVGFRRQHAIGNYIVDFCAPREKFVIELDGSQHLDRPGFDEERTAFLRSKGYRLIRIWDSDVTNDLTGVTNAIVRALESS